jgi:exosome complex component CSL4
MLASGQSVVPGLCIGKFSPETILGDGVHRTGDYIFASTIGYLRISESVVHVERHALADSVPRIGAIVTARITQVQVSFAEAEILSVEEQVVRERFNGRIRIEDVRSFEKDAVVMYDCFRPGDIVCARVLSFGAGAAGRSVYLTTAENELGVRVAKSASGRIMVPVSWKEMQDPVSMEIQPRKVAKLLVV